MLAVGHSHFVRPYLDTCTLSLDYGAQQATIYLSRLNWQKEQKLVVIGDKGAAVFDDTKPWDQKATFYKNYAEPQGKGFTLHKDFEGEGEPLKPEEPLRLELEHFLESILHHRQPLTAGRDAIKVIQLLVAADESLKKQSWVSIAEFL